MPKKLDASHRVDDATLRESAPVSSPLDMIRSWLRSSIARSPASPRGRHQQRRLSMERLDERVMMAGDLENLPPEPAGYISYEQGEGEGSDAPSALNSALADQALLEMMLDQEHSSELLSNRTWGSSLMIDSQNVTSAGVAPSGDTLAVGKSNGTLAFYTAGTGIEQTEKALNIGAPITSLKYLTNGNLVVTTDRSFRVIDASGVTVKTVNYTQDMVKMNTIDNGFFVFVYAGAGLPSSVMLYDQKGEQTYKKDIGPNVGVVSVTNDGSTMILGYPSGASAIPITAQGKGIGLDFYQYMGRGLGTVGTAEINADGSGRFLFAYQNGYGTNLIVTDASGKTLVRSFSLGMSTAVQNMVSLGGGRFMVDTLQDVTANTGRSRQTRIFKYELGTLKEEATATKQGGYKYSPLSVSADMTTVVTSQYDSVVVGSLPSAVADTKALQDGAKKIGPAVISSAQLDNPLGKPLVNGQRADLVGLAQTYSTLTTLKYNNTAVYQKFLATFADWRDENASATAKAKGWSLEYFYYARGQEFESFNKDIGSYDDALGRMMEAGMNAVLADIRFQDPSSALTSLRSIPTDPIYGSTLAHIAQIGIKLPSEQQIIDACKAILINGSDAYQDMQGIYQNRTDNAVRRFNSNNYTDYVQPPPTVPETTFDRKTWIAAMDIADELARKEMARNAQPMPAGTEAVNVAASLSPAQIVSAMKSEISALLAQGKTMESILRDLQLQNGGQSLKALEREKVRVGTDVVTKMNRASLEAERDLATKALQSATIRSAESEITHWNTMLESVNGLLRLIPAGGTVPDFTKDPRAEIWRRYIERTSTDPKPGEIYVVAKDTVPLGKIGVSGSCIKPLDLEIAPLSNGQVTFTLEGDSMVNFFIDVNDVEKVSTNAVGALSMTPDFSLALTGTTNDNHPVTWSNSKSGTSAETVSGRLPAGTYTLTVKNNSKEGPANGGFYPLAQKPFVNFRVHTDIKPFDSRKIEGRVSIEGSPVSMPVSMSVAEFANGNRISDVNKLSPLNPSLPVWVVVHGMNSHEDTGPMESIAKELALEKSVSGQVVTINWEQAAIDAGLPLGADAPWTPAIGKWVANQLLSLGLAPSKVNIVGHSHGTYVAYFAAETIQSARSQFQDSTVNSIVALDPAGNEKRFSGVDDGVIDFKKVTRNSVAIEGSLITGSNRLASTADTSFQVDSPLYTFWNEHSLPITTFSNMLRYERNIPGQLPEPLTLTQIMTPVELQSTPLSPNQYRESFEGYIGVDYVQKTDKYGIYYEALPRKITTKKQGSITENVRNLVAPSSFA